MAKQSDYSVNEELKNLEFNDSEVECKKPFIEPEISPAVDVLEATTFFQTTTSGATN